MSTLELESFAMSLSTGHAAAADDDDDDCCPNCFEDSEDCRCWADGLLSEELY